MADDHGYLSGHSPVAVCSCSCSVTFVGLYSNSYIRIYMVSIRAQRLPNSATIMLRRDRIHLNLLKTVVDGKTTLLWPEQNRHIYTAQPGTSEWRPLAGTLVAVSPCLQDGQSGAILGQTERAGTNEKDAAGDVTSPARENCYTWTQCLVSLPLPVSGRLGPKFMLIM